MVKRKIKYGEEQTERKPMIFLTKKYLHQRYESIPEGYTVYKKKLSTRYGLEFYEDLILVPKNLRNAVISLLLKGHSDINQMSMEARHLVAKPYRSYPEEVRRLRPVQNVR